MGERNPQSENLIGWTHWTEWAGCDASSPRQAYRTREVKHGREGDGTEGCAGNMRETRGCPNDKPTDCLLSLWTDWAECDRTSNMIYVSLGCVTAIISL